MALDLSPLLTDHHLRPWHMQALAAIYNGNAEDSYTASDQSATKTSVSTNIHTLVDDIAAGVATDKTTAISAINAIVDAPLHDGSSLSTDNANALKTAIAAAINAGISFNATALKDDIDDEIAAFADTVSINKSDVLLAIKTELDTLIAADTEHFTYTDVWCAGTGRYERRRDGGDPTDTSLKHCDVCDGFGRKAVQNQIIIIKPPVTTYP